MRWMDPWYIFGLLGEICNPELDIQLAVLSIKITLYVSQEYISSFVVFFVVKDTVKWRDINKTEFVLIMNVFRMHCWKEIYTIKSGGR